jgi:hypothetical protein
MSLKKWSMLLSVLQTCPVKSKSFPRRWKWLILSLHQAVQGTFVCALRGVDTAGINVLTDKSADEMWQWLDVDSHKIPRPAAPLERLAPMLVLFKRVKNAKHLQDPQRLRTTTQMNWDIKKLNSLRNEFSHFVPKSFSVEISGLSRIAKHCCYVIEHLALAHSTFPHHMTGNKNRRLKQAIATLRSTL